MLKKMIFGVLLLFLLPGLSWSLEVYHQGEICANYYIKGAANKLTLEATFVDQDEEIASTNVQNETIITFQIAAGF